MKKSDMSQDKAMVKKAMGQHDKQQHMGKKTKLALKKGGSTCGMKKGGPTGEDRMKMGRNMSRAANQKSK
jgi:hypothetical protein